MTEEELDAILSKKLKSCVAGRCLPGDFSARLKASIRRSRRHVRARIAAAAVVASVLGMVLLGVAGTPQKAKPRECALIAARSSENKGQEISAWMLFGVFRECFKRNRSNKRKEEE